MCCWSSTISHSTHSLYETVALSLYLPLLLYQCRRCPNAIRLRRYFSVILILRHSLLTTLSRSLSLSLSLIHGVTLSVSSFPPFSSHTILLLFSIQVRSFPGSPFSDEFDEDNQMAKAHTIACGFWKTNPSYVHLQSLYLTLCPCISSLIFLPLSLVLFH